MNASGRKQAATSPLEWMAVAMLGALAAVAALVWVSAGVAGALFGTGWTAIPFSDMAAVVGRLPDRLGDPRSAWPAASAERLPGPVGFYASAFLVSSAVAALVAGTYAGRRRLHRSSKKEHAARWASAHDLRGLLSRNPPPSRIVVGTHRGRLVASEARQSVVVVAPAQSGKTTGIAIPAILEWPGPVLAASVKSDLLTETARCRLGLGSVMVYDPTEATAFSSRASWTPLAGCTDWRGARRVARWLTDGAQPGRTGLDDAGFWYSAAAKLLAPLLFAAATSGRTIADVVRWVDTQEYHQVVDALEQAGDATALHAAEATWQRDDRQRSSIYTTAETVLEAFADPGVLNHSRIAEINADQLLAGPNTLYLCASLREQRRLRPVFVALISEVLEHAYGTATANGAPLDPPLLVVLDEAANIAPLPELDTIASTAPGLGIVLVTVLQDLAQAKERWGHRAATIVNNHRAKLFGPGLADLETLNYATRLLAEQEHREVSATIGDGRRSTTESTRYRPLVPTHRLRELPNGSALLVYGNRPPCELRLRPWFADRGLRDLASGRRASG